MPRRAFVVLVLFANYDKENRKAIDVALLAFKALQQRRPQAFLFIHAVGMAEMSRGMASCEPRNASHAHRRRPPAPCARAR